MISIYSLCYENDVEALTHKVCLTRKQGDSNPIELKFLEQFTTFGSPPTIVLYLICYLSLDRILISLIILFLKDSADPLQGVNKLDGFGVIVSLF